VCIDLRVVGTLPARRGPRPAARARLSVEIVLAQIDEMNVARRRRGRRELGPLDAYCQRCEAARPVYRLL